jgi:alkylation response protein AidB-like acyl-CoA dehydrogenase
MSGPALPRGELRVLRNRVLRFVEDHVYPAEAVLDRAPREQRKAAMQRLMGEAKKAGLWALGHPKEIGGGGLSFLDYVYINEVIGRSFHAMQGLGTLSLQDSLMLLKFAPEHLRERYLPGLVAGDFVPSVGITEPAVASSDPTQLQTSARLEKGEWIISGRKWFTTGAADAAFTTALVRTEPDAKPHSAFSMIVVPTGAPGYRILRETPILGIEGGHYEVLYDNVRVPEDHLIGRRGEGFAIAQTRLGPGRIFHCMRWLGQAQRAFDLMCRRLHERRAFGEPLARKQLMQQHVFESAAEIQACRLLTLKAARKLDAGEQARDEIGLIKVVGSRMLHNVIDRAMQVYGAMGLTPDTPLDIMYRHARTARFYDGPDEVHVESVAKRLLRPYADSGAGIDFGDLDLAD